MTQPAHGVERTAVRMELIFSFHADPKAQTQVIRWWQAPFFIHWVILWTLALILFLLLFSVLEMEPRGSRAYLSLATSSKLIMYGQSLGYAMVPSAWSAIAHLCLRMFSTSFL